MQLYCYFRKGCEDLKVLFVASEAHPFIKVGGLGDVAHALPRALRKLGIDVRVILPKYGSIKEEFKSEMVNIAHFNVPLGWRNQYCGLQYMEYDDIPFYFIDNEYYFKREGAYGYYDDGERFAFFDKAVIESINHMEGFTPDVIHCNDWHSGAVIPLLKAFYSHKDRFKNIKTLFTVHNLQYQGVFPKEILNELLGLGDEYFVDERLKFNEAVSFMKGALNMADKISTVSNTYAEEIKTSYYGEGLDSLLWYRKYDLSGIVNGIDTDIYNPETDKELAFNFNKDDFNNKLKNKTALQSELGLTVDENIPMIGIVSRLVSQKGFDLIARVLDEILELDLQIVLLGTGERDFEQMFKHYGKKYPQKVSTNILFNNKLAKKIYASSDMFLMPSKFEPCGIGQLLALRYGTIPIVRETGGLKDTVTMYNKITGEGNGFSFANYNAHDMLYTIQKAVKLYKDKTLWNRLVKTAMSEDNSWDKSAQVYIDLYNSMIK
jgi:starch synthase